jgi:hypothetical protein
MNIFAEVAAILKKKGWNKGGLKDRNSDKVCLIGAFAEYEGWKLRPYSGIAVDAAGNEFNAYQKLDKIHNEELNKLVSVIYGKNYDLNHPTGTLYSWNDNNMRTEDEIFAALEKASL